MIFASIKFQNIDDTLLIFSKFAVRLIACFLVINAMAAIIILKLSNSIPIIFGIYHLIITVALILPFIKRFKLARQK